MRTRLSGWPLAWGGCALLLACLAVEHGPDCRVSEYKQGDRCCSKCPPGQKLEAECSGDSRTICEPCEGSHFQAGWTQEQHCTPHAYCDQNAGLVVHTDGNAERNVVCRCRSGTHCSSHECQTCRQNKLCGPGEGVQQEASHVNDTVCVECPDGFFSNVSSATARCQAWSSCEDKNLIQKTSGTQKTDVVCSDSMPPPNEEAKRTHLLALLLLLPLAVLLVGGGFFVFRQRQHKGPQELPRDQGQVQQPTEEGFEEDCPAFPVQETLLGGQPVAQEDGKDSRLAEQEQV